jgi:phage baseplate assembly protein W
MARAFAVEDGNLNNKPITTSRVVTSSDIDLTFAKKASGDVFKKTDAAAIKQSIKNLLLTNYGEKPFQPLFGGDLNRFLFELSDEFDEFEVQDRVASAISNYEPRAAVRDVSARIDPENHNVDITVKFQVITTLENVEVNVSLTRLR